MKVSDVLELLIKGGEVRLFEVAGTPVSAATLLILLAVVLGSWWASKVAQFSIHRAIQRKGVKDAGSVAVLQRLIHYAIMLLGLAIALDTVGIDLGALFAAGAIFAVGIGFAMQNIAQNFVSGVILLVERAIKPGDILEVDGAVVRVLNMGIRSTLVRTRDEEDLIVPNATLVQSTVKNFTMRDRAYRLRASVGVVYSEDMCLVRRTLQNAADGFKSRSTSAPPVVLLTDFGSSSVDFEVSIWINNPWDARLIKSGLNEALWWALKEQNITIAFPQLDLHFDAPTLEAMASKSKT